MADIVLRDRNGREVQYPGVNYLKVNTVDGGTQGFAAYDPETLTAENIKSGVTVGDVEGALEVPQILENVPVALDFSSGGNMEFVAPDGYAVKSGIVQKPANLLPGNIAKDVDIAGVVGTLESGGGVERYLFLVSNTSYGKTYTTTGVNTTDAKNVTLPPTAEIYSIYGIVSSGGASSNATTGWSGTTKPYTKYTLTETETAKTLRFSYDVKYVKTYGAYLHQFNILYYVPEFIVKTENDGTRIMYATNKVTTYPRVSNLVYITPVDRVDLSDSQIADFQSYAFQDCPGSEVIMPATTASLGTYAFTKTSSGTLRTIDFSKCTSVPTCQSNTFYEPATDLQIKVPAALYDEWIAATNWSSLASYIVPV
jgi:hypothetical protein